MHLLNLATSFLLSLPITLAADSRYCIDKTILTPSDFTLQESADNTHLPKLAAYFQSTGKNVSVSDVLDSSNRALTKGSPPVGTGSPIEAWAWNSGDYTTTKWVPQGITSSGDALGVGTWEGRSSWIVSWHRDDGQSVRVSFVDRATHQYRHVMLVEPTADDDFDAIAIHAGGIMWYGNILFVVDTNNGIRAFDLDNIWEVEIADGVGKLSDGSGYSADTYRYVLPQIRSYKWTPGSTSPFRFSWVSLDRSDTPDSLLVGEFVSEGETDANGDPVPIRMVKYNLDYTTRRLSTNSNGLATSSWAYCVDIWRMQGGVSHGGTFYVSRSNGRDPNAGDLFTWVPGQLAKEFPGWFMAGNEDLSWNDGKGEYYTVTEYDGGRYILTYKP